MKGYDTDVNVISYRKEWTSPNGKYFVLVRKFKDDLQILVTHRIIDNGRKRPIRYRDLPKYVVNRMEKLRIEAEEGY